MGPEFVGRVGKATWVRQGRTYGQAIERVGRDNACDRQWDISQALNFNRGKGLFQKRKSSARPKEGPEENQTNDDQKAGIAQKKSRDFGGPFLGVGLTVSSRLCQSYLTWGKELAESWLKQKGKNNDSAVIAAAGK